MARPSIRAGSLTDLSLGTGGTPSVDAPEAAEGELIVIFLALEGGGTVTHPEGFQSLLALDVAGNMSGHIIGKIAGAEEPASYTFSVGDILDQWGAQACVMDDVDISNFPTSAVAGTSKANETSNVSSVTVPGMTLPADCLLIGHVASRVSNGTISSDGGVMTPLWDTWDMGDRSARSFQESPSAGPTGDRTFAHSSATLITAGLLALAPAEDSGIEGSGALAAGSSSVAGSGSAYTAISGSGALSAQAVALAGSGVVLNVRNLVLTQAQGRELRDEA